MKMNYKKIKFSDKPKYATKPTAVTARAARMEWGTVRVPIRFAEMTTGPNPWTAAIDAQRYDGINTLTTEQMNQMWNTGLRP